VGKGGGSLEGPCGNGLVVQCGGAIGRMPKKRGKKRIIQIRRDLKKYYTPTKNRKTCPDALRGGREKR